jgi:hemerythrin
MKIEWQDYLAVGVVEIDRQHRQLFDAFNAFLAACDADQGAEEVSRLFWFLTAYVATHFADEERLQKRIGFPDYLQHREQHRAFTGKVAELKERFEGEGPTREFISTVTLTMTGWLIEHISGMDRAIGRFMKEQNKVPGSLPGK